MTEYKFEFSVDDLFESTSASGSTECDDDPIAARLFAIKPPGKGDSGMAEER